MVKLIEYNIDKETGYLLFPVRIRNKHGVSFDIIAKLDTGKTMGEISYRIFSALGLDTQLPISSDSKSDALNVPAHAWVAMEQNSDFVEFEGDFRIIELNNTLDLVIGMDWIRQYFKINIDPKKGIFEIRIQ